MDNSAAEQRQPPVAGSPLEALDVDGIGAVGVGTALWAVALVAAVLCRDRLGSAGHSSWIWIAVVGTGVGLLALPYLIRRRRRPPK